MADGLSRILSKTGFDPENFVNKQAQGGRDELEEIRTQVQVLADDTAVALKKNVYKNYSHFIETAKEISILEGEMYQLSHMLTEQKSVMNAMLEMSLTSEKVHEGPENLEQPAVEEENTKNNLAILLEKVEGCSSITDVSERYLVHNGDLVELDPESFIQIQKVHAFLLSDSLMIASWLPHRRGPVKYRFEALYELDSLAVVNARDVGSCKNAFKLLMFPDTRMFQAESPKEKRQWLDILEETKKKKTASDNQRKESSSSDRNSVRISTVSSRASTYSYDPTNPFMDDIEEEDQTSSAADGDLLHVDWVQEVPEDLDVYIALRDFEGAVDLVGRVNEYLQGCENTLAFKEYRTRIDHRIKQLTEELMNELQISRERSIKGGPKGARRAVTQLIRLGKSTQACSLFLKNRSSIIKNNLRQIKIEGATTLHVKRLCREFFSSLMKTSKEFLKAFPDYYGCYSSFVLWSKQELETFVELFRGQVFASKVGLSTVAECVQEAHICCDQMSEIGLELTFILTSILAADIERVIKENREYQLDAIKLRATEDIWRPTNLLNVEALEKYVEEMKDIGIVNIEKYTYDECFVGLTANTTQFSKAFLTYTEDVLKLYSEEFHNVICKSLADIFTAQIAHIDCSLETEKFRREHKFILKNATFLVEELLSEVVRRFEKQAGHVAPQLSSLNQLLDKVEETSKTVAGEFV